MRDKGRRQRPFLIPLPSSLIPFFLLLATAVCCNNDITAMELLDALERRGRRVPETMSVVGFDDIPIAGHARVGLTTVRQDAELMGGVAAEMLLEAIVAGRHPSRLVLVPTEFVVRTSTGPAPEV